MGIGVNTRFKFRCRLKSLRHSIFRYTPPLKSRHGLFLRDFGVKECWSLEVNPFGVRAVKTQLHSVVVPTLRNTNRHAILRSYGLAISNIHSFAIGIDGN